MKGKRSGFRVEAASESRDRNVYTSPCQKCCPSKIVRERERSDGFRQKNCVRAPEQRDMEKSVVPLGPLHREGDATLKEVTPGNNKQYLMEIANNTSWK